MKIPRRAPMFVVTSFALLVAACSSASPGASAPAASVPVTTVVPSTSTTPSTPVASVDESSGPTDGVVGGSDPVGLLPGGNPVPGGAPKIVIPRAGVQNPHPVPIAQLLVAVRGHDVAVQIEYWSGVEPCSVLARVDVKRAGDVFTVSPHEGATDAGKACIDIAQLKATIVDLGELAPGTYTVRAASGDAEDVRVTVS